MLKKDSPQSVTEWWLGRAAWLKSYKYTVTSEKDILKNFVVGYILSNEVMGKYTIVVFDKE